MHLHVFEAMGNKQRYLISDSISITTGEENDVSGKCGQNLPMAEAIKSFVGGGTLWNALAMCSVLRQMCCSTYKLAFENYIQKNKFTKLKGFLLPQTICFLYCSVLQDSYVVLGSQVNIGLQ